MKNWEGERKNGVSVWEISVRKGSGKERKGMKVKKRNGRDKI